MSIDSTTVIEAFDLGDDVLLVRGTIDGYWATDETGSPLSPVLYSQMSVAELRAEAKGRSIDGYSKLAKPDLLTALAKVGVVDDPGTLATVEARGWVSAMANHFDDVDTKPANYDEDGNRSPDVKPRAMTKAEKLDYCKSLLIAAVPPDALTAPVEPVALNIAG